MLQVLQTAFAWMSVRAIHILAWGTVGIASVLVIQHIHASPENIFLSPDETANYFFADTFRSKSQLSVSSPENAATQGGIRPRSVKLREESGEWRIVPGSFLGLPLMQGTLAKLVGMRAVAYVPLIVWLLSLILGYRLILGTRYRGIAPWALMGTTLVLPLWYFLAHPWFHNGLYVALLCLCGICIAWALRSARWKARMLWSLAGVTLGMGLAVRTVEVVWIAPVTIGTWLLWRGWKNRDTYFLAAGFLPLLLIVLWNQNLYGNALSFGDYSTEIVDVSSVSTAASSVFAKVFRAVLPFGADIGLTLENIRDHAVIIGAGFFACLAVALGVLTYNFLVRKRQMRMSAVLTFCLFLLAFLYQLVYYGSSQVYDGDPYQLSIGSSFIRYEIIWLLVGGLIIGCGAYWLSERVVAWQKILLTVCIGLWSMNGMLTMTTEPTVGLVEQQKVLRDYQAIRARLLERLPADAIVIGGGMDKILYPYRHVVVTAPGHSEQWWNAAVQRPVYVYVDDVSQSSSELPYGTVMEGEIIPVGGSIGGALHLVSRAK